MKPLSLFLQGRYSAEWVRDFYDQTAIWWGPDSEEPAYDLARIDAVERLCGPAPKRILELGAGSGCTAAVMADRGHSLVAVELSPLRAQQARELLRAARAGAAEVVEADFYSVELEGRFDVITYWDGFGVGSDGDQRRLLRRIAHDWLAPGGSALIDVFSPIRPARDAGKEERLDPLPGVPGSVEMLRRCHFDALHCRWIDEWVPTADPKAALAQTVRCYTPADLLLLLEGTGLALKRLEVDGEPLDLHSDQIAVSGPLLDAWSYLVQLEAAT